jgi:hypothetical protein
VRVVPYHEEQEALALLREALLRTKTTAQKQALELQIERLYRLRDESIAAAKRSLVAFGVRTVKGWRPEYFHHHLGKRLQGLIERIAKQDTLISEIAIAPPRHGKSLLSCIIAPVWAMGKRPGTRVGVVTYAASLSETHSLEARDLARSPAVAEIFGDPVVATKTSVNKIEFWSAWGGSYYAAGVDGTITGKGFELLIADDLIKGEEEARSASQRQKAHGTYHSVATTRISTGGAIMLQGTTWHGDDPLQREMLSGNYHITRYPAIAEEDEGFRKAGEALCPVLRPIAFLHDLRHRLPAEVWACLYQGRPGRSGSEYIKPAWLTVYETAPETQAARADQVWITMDAGQKTHAKADPTVCHVWAWWKAKDKEPPRMALLDRSIKVGASIEEGKQMLRLLWARWGARVVQTAGGVLIEDTANGAAILQQGVPAQGEEPGIPSGLLRLFSPVSVPGKDKSKEARAGYLHSFAQRLRVSIPEVSALPTVHDVVDSWANFPRAAHDEDVDCASMLVIHLEQNTTSKAAGLRYLMAMTG